MWTSGQDRSYQQYRSEDGHGCERADDGNGYGDAAGNDLHDTQRQQPAPPTSKRRPDGVHIHGLGDCRHE